MWISIEVLTAQHSRGVDGLHCQLRGFGDGILWRLYDSFFRLVVRDPSRVPHGLRLRAVGQVAHLMIP